MDNNDNKKLSPEELLKEIKARGLELSDEQLEKITGGWHVTPEGVYVDDRPITKRCICCGSEDVTNIWIHGIYAYTWCNGCHNMMP